MKSILQGVWVVVVVAVCVYVETADGYCSGAGCGTLASALNGKQQYKKYVPRVGVWRAGREGWRGRGGEGGEGGEERRGIRKRKRKRKRKWKWRRKESGFWVEGKEGGRRGEGEGRGGEGERGEGGERVYVRVCVCEYVCMLVCVCEDIYSTRVTTTLHFSSTFRFGHHPPHPHTDIFPQRRSGCSVY